MKIIPFVFLLQILNSCNCDKKDLTNTNSQTSRTRLTTKSIYGDWTIHEIIDSLYADTITHRNYFDSNSVDSFYLSKIQGLVKKITLDGNDSLTLFPESAFDQIIGKDAWVSWGQNVQTTIYGSEIELNQSQMDRLMKIINNPLNFSWAECGTWTPSSRFDFYHKGKFVRSLDIGCSWQLKTNFQKVKFGTFESGTDFRLLCNEIGLKNE